MVVTTRKTATTAGEEFYTIYSTLNRLHDIKERLYHGSWKAHGELRSIIPQIDRKIDRLNVLLGDSPEEHPDEGLIDTVADLAVYAVKYFGWQVEQEPEVFRQVAITWLRIPDPQTARYVGDAGFEANCWLLGQRHTTTHSYNLRDFAQCATSWRAAHVMLVAGLYPPKTTRLTPLRKFNIIANLAIAALMALVYLRREYPEAWDAYSAKWGEPTSVVIDYGKGM
jgi:hypothetical protein